MNTRVNPTRLTRLDFLWLELTSQCNLNCIHCYGAFGRPLHGAELSGRQWGEILQQARDQGCRRVQFTGGEALVFAPLHGLIRKANRMGYEVIEVFTNATLLRDRDIRLFRKNHVQLAVSVYSNQEEIHDSITGVKGSFRATASALRQLRDAGIPFRIAVIVMRPNQDALHGMQEWIKEMGASNSFRVDPVRPSGRGSDPDLRPDHVPLRKREESVFYPGHEFQPRSGLTTCWKGKMAVTPSGKVLPCIFARDLVCGNLQEDSLETVIQGERLQKLWKLTVNDVPECRECRMRSLCADCRYLAYAGSGDLYARNPRCIAGSRNAERKSASDPAPGCSPGTLPKRSTSVRSWEVDDELILYDVQRHRTHVLNPSAALLWKHLDGSTSFDHLTRLFLEHFEASEAAVRTDVRTALTQFSRSGLIENA